MSEKGRSAPDEQVPWWTAHYQEPVAKDGKIDRDPMVALRWLAQACRRHAKAADHSDAMRRAIAWAEIVLGERDA